MIADENDNLQPGNETMVNATLLNRIDGSVVKEMTFSRMETAQEFFTKVLDNNYKRWSRGLKVRIILIIE